MKKIGLFLLFISFPMAHADPLLGLNLSYVANSSASLVQIKGLKKELNVSIVEVGWLKTLFSELSQNTDIPFRWVWSGCDERAHKIALLLEEKGVWVGKINVQSDRFFLGKKKSGFNPRWRHHVAPFVFVKSKKNEKYEVKVIDPSIAQGPVDVDTWVELITSHSKPRLKKVEIYSRFQFRTGDGYSPPDDYDPVDTQAMEEGLKLRLEYQEGKRNPENDQVLPIPD